MDQLVERISEELTSVIADMEPAKATEVAELLRSDAIGVRSLERLYDVDKETLLGVLPRCDAQRLYKCWQKKFKPENIERQRLINEQLSIYVVKWEKIPEATMKLLRRGKWLKKTLRCELIRLIVGDVMTDKPLVLRSFFTTAMVNDFPAALQDRSGKPLECTYYEQKLKCRFDEAVRARDKKDRNEIPNIPEAYGCIKWRVAGLPEGETIASLNQKKQTLIDMHSNTRPRDWDRKTIENLMTLTYKHQRDDINSQVQLKRRRGAGEPQQDENIQVKSTETIVTEWPFLFESGGMHIHFKLLTEVDFFQKLRDFDEQQDGPLDLLRFLIKNGEETFRRTVTKQYNRALRRETCADPHMIATLIMIIHYFEEEQKQLLIEIEKTTSFNEVLQNMVLPPTPVILSLGPVFEAKKFYFAVDGQPVSTACSFVNVFSVLFQSYYVTNLKYGGKVGNTLEFYQRAVAGIAPDRGTKRQKKNYRSKVADRVQTLLDDHASWMQQQNEQRQHSEEEDGNLA